MHVTKAVRRTSQAIVQTERRGEMQERKADTKAATTLNGAGRSSWLLREIQEPFEPAVYTLKIMGQSAKMPPYPPFAP